MHAGARQIPTPDRRARLQVGEVEEVLPAEEVLADVGDPALHFRFPGGVARDSGIDDEAAVLRVLEEDARDRGRIAIGAGDDHLVGLILRSFPPNQLGNASEKLNICRSSQVACQVFGLPSLSGRLQWTDHDKALKFIVTMNNYEP
jgi:hypothetical protein